MFRASGGSEVASGGLLMSSIVLRSFRYPPHRVFPEVALDRLRGGRVGPIVDLTLIGVV